MVWTFVSFSYYIKQTDVGLLFMIGLNLNLGHIFGFTKP
jgi:hypothetical protein